MLDELLARHDRVVLATWFKDVAAQLSEALRTNTGVEVFGPVSGEVPFASRLETAQVFAAASGKAVFVATIASCEMSMNDLVAASATHFNDLHWVPDKLWQFAARVHRQGQTRQVEESFTRALGTLDEMMIQALQTKTGVIETVGVGGMGTNQASDMMRSLAKTDEGSLDPIESLMQALMIESIDTAMLED